MLFTYLNPVLRYGLENLARDAKAAGIDGCLLTDVSVEEAGPYVDAMRAAGLDTVFLAAPTSTPARLKLVAKYSSGFVYLVSRTGVTGERAALSDALAAVDRRHARDQRSCRSRRASEFRRPSRRGAVAKIADGVVVGSAIVRLIEQNAGEAGLEEIRAIAAQRYGPMTREEALRGTGGVPENDRCDRR